MEDTDRPHPFIVFVVSFIILNMLFLIKDLDNPFDYS